MSNMLDINNKYNIYNKIQRILNNWRKENQIRLKKYIITSIFKNRLEYKDI